MTTQDPTIATLEIGHSFSRCLGCGGNADPAETHHIHGGRRGDDWTTGALDREGGCGAVFTGAVDHNGVPYTDAEMEAMRAEWAARRAYWAAADHAHTKD